MNIYGYIHGQLQIVRVRRRKKRKRKRRRRKLPSPVNPRRVKMATGCRHPILPVAAIPAG